MNYKKVLILAFGLFKVSSVFSQQQYQHSANLTNLKNNKLSLELITPSIKKNTIVFSFPKIIPGTYAVSDYGRFISNLKTVIKDRIMLSTKKLDINQWQIINASKLHKITYEVEDISDAAQKHCIPPMAATIFESEKNVVMNTPGVFGFIEGMQKLPFQISFTKPVGFFASTSLRPTSSTSARDVFIVSSVNELYDSLIMYNILDTTTVRA
ncbi:MAG TPA: hypothetical protein VEY51_01660 [Chondromyces sp.]|nr:hypothetical protein [Chondromyces sp.]